jgi:hypothetical protein
MRQQTFILGLRRRRRRRRRRERERERYVEGGGTRKRKDNN